MDMPSYGARSHLEAAGRADEFFVLLSDASRQLANIDTMRCVLGADADALAAIVGSDNDAAYDALRNLQDYANALARLTEVALERVTEINDRDTTADGDGATDAAKPNGVADHIEAAAA